MTADTPKLDEGYDYIVYFGEINFHGYNTLSNLLERKRENGRQTKKGYFIPVTSGGQADAAYRIARALGHYYPDDIRFMVLDRCKSAGTLVAIGANELIVSDRGELGPLDVQIQKKEELFEMSSGLDIVQALIAVQEQSMLAFRQYFLEIRLGTNLGTSFAAKLATELVSSLVSPITSQIDPIRIGEHQRALRIATAYGLRLNKKFSNTSPEQIDMLLAGYPSHGFVIDRKEAAELFTRVRDLNEQESTIDKFLREQTEGLSDLAGQGKPTVLCFE